MTPITQQIDLFAKYLHQISGKMTFAQKSKAKAMLEHLLGQINEREVIVQRLKARINNSNVFEYTTTLERMVMLAKCLDFDLTEIQMLEMHELDFFYLNKDRIKKDGPITIERFKKYIELVRYFYRTEHRQPQTLNELISKLSELNELRKQD